MRMGKSFGWMALAVLLLGIVACTTTNGWKEDPFLPDIPEMPDGDMGGTNEDGSVNAPEMDYTISEWDGEKADDASADVVGVEEDFYWEANKFSTKVYVTYAGKSATVACDNEDVIADVQDAYVTLDLLTNSVKNVEVILSGKSTDGALKVYGEKKFKLTLDGVELTSTRGPAVNSQCKKRIFVHLSEGKTNRFTDAASYKDDTYYMAGANPDDEDRKGCFFAEGNLIFSGTGVLEVNGLKKHGVVTDGYFWMRPGVTIVVPQAAKNAIHVKGDEDDAIGVVINGGLIYANIASTAGKGIKTDLDVVVNGGKLLLNTSGGSEYDDEEADTSSPACIKTDGNVTINGGTLTLKSTGEGGKGLNVDGTLAITGGVVTVTTTGGKYIYNAAKDLTASPKGVKADGNITIDGGVLNISVTGKSDGSEGLESKAGITINDGEVSVYAYDDAMNAAGDVTINGGKVYCYAVNNDGIDSNGTLNLNGGTVTVSGSGAPESGFDCDRSQWFMVRGGVLVGTGGSSVSPSTSSMQNTVIYNGISAKEGAKLAILNSSDKTVLDYALPRTLNGMSLFFSSPDLVKGTYTVKLDGTKLGTFTVNGVVTTVGSSGGGGGRP